MEKESQISLWELLFSGQIITSAFVVLILVLGVVVLYMFFDKYFFLKGVYGEDDFVDNIADCLYDHRLDSAKDLCKRVSSPESRIIRKGLDKMDKSPFEIFITINNQVGIETLQMRKNLFKFSIWAKIIMLLGGLGTGLSLVFFFTEGSSDLFSEKFYVSFFPVSMGAFFAAVVYLLKLVLVSLTHKLELELITKGNKFLEIIEEINQTEQK